jgi:uncharacterized protein YbbC (DUF1343 family)
MQKSLPFIFFLFFYFTFSLTIAQVRTGLDIVVANNYAQLVGKKIGLICNQTSQTSTGEFAPKLFVKQKSFKLAALFSPEHGLFGERKAGEKIDSALTFEGVPVYSLYGAARRPTKNMLKGLNALVFDIQDIGVRPYTFLSTMIYAMEAAAENGIEFIVLDRPDPLSGERIEGNILDTSLRSFVGAIPVPYIHGMTLGELAKMAKGEKWFRGSEKLKLTVIEMKGWKREMYWNETGLRWIAPSPNIPTFASVLGCAMFGAIGELGILSVGIGSDLPFLRIGSKLINPDIFEHIVQSSLPKGISSTREDYTVPFEGSTKTFFGMKITLPENIKEIRNLYGPEFLLLKKLLADSVFAKSYKMLPFSTTKMFEKVTGRHELAKLIEQQSILTPILSGWKRESTAFGISRRKYLLYQ